MSVYRGSLPPLNQVDPVFVCNFNKKEHVPKLDKELDIFHFLAGVGAQVWRLLTTYWDIFAKKGLFVSVKDYECVIDTVTACPISAKKVNYGPHEMPVMRKCIAALSKLGQIS